MAQRTLPDAGVIAARLTELRWRGRPNDVAAAEFGVGVALIADLRRELGYAGDLTCVTDSIPSFSGVPHVYAIRCNARSLVHIKIGSALDIWDRMSTLQVGCPIELQLLGFVPSAGLDEERRIQCKIAHHRVRGEWFTGNVEVYELIEKEFEPWQSER